MNNVVIWCLISIHAVVVTAHFYVLFILGPRWIDTWKFYFLPFLCLSMCSLALYWFMQPATFSTLFLGGLYSMWAAVFAWEWWNDHHDRRKRLAQKALERVQQTESGLKVVSESGHGR